MYYYIEILKLKISKRYYIKFIKERGKKMCNNHKCKQNLSKWSYSLVSKKCYDTDANESCKYGIMVAGTNYEMTLYDIHNDKETITKMIELFNIHQLSPIHLQEVIEDMTV